MFSFIFLMKLPLITAYLFLCKLKTRKYPQSSSGFTDQTSLPTTGLLWLLKGEANREGWTTQPYVQRLKHTWYPSKWKRYFFLLSLTWHGVGWCPCRPLPAAERQGSAPNGHQTACEHQNRTARMRKTPFLLSHVNSWMRARCLTGEYVVPGCWPVQSVWCAFGCDLGAQLAATVHVAVLWHKEPASM